MEERLKRQRMAYDLHPKVVCLVSSLKAKLPASVYEDYMKLVNGFFRGTVTLRDFVLRAEELLPTDLLDLHSQLRGLLCELAETNLAQKRLVRRGIRNHPDKKKPPAKVAPEATLPSLGDITARLSLRAAQQGLEEFDVDAVSRIRDGVITYMETLLLAALPTKTDPDGFISPVIQFPKVKLHHIESALQLRAADAFRTEWAKERTKEELSIVEEVMNTPLANGSTGNGS